MAVDSRAKGDEEIMPQLPTFGSTPAQIESMLQGYHGNKDLVWGGIW